MEKRPPTPAEIRPAGPAWLEATWAGLDMDLIEDCLSRSPRERLRIHEAALRTADQLSRAMKERRDGPDDDPRLPDPA